MIQTIYLHCTDTPNGRHHTASEIHRWHSDPKPAGNGWDGIGYHYLIQLDGTREAGRPEYWQGAHVAGDNRHSLGIVLVGRDQFTNEQFSALAALLGELRQRYPGAKIRGHRDTDHGRDCPGFDARQWCRRWGLDPQ